MTAAKAQGEYNLLFNGRDVTFNLVAKSSLSINLISQDFESINSRPG